jgi:hypothetical protein
MWILPENAVARSTPSRLQAGDPEVIYFQRYTAPASHDFSHQHCKTLHSQADNGYGAVLGAVIGVFDPGPETVV